MLLDARQTTTTVALPNFGECTFAESEVINFPWGLPGFADLHRFLVLASAEQAGYIWLQSLDDTSVALPLCDPWSLFDDYEAPLPQYAKESLGLENPDDFCLMCVCVVAKGAVEMTINLLAPVVINLKTRVARQVTLESQRYSLRTPIPRRPAAEPALEVLST
ncbi:MAG: flagellar assembly protein FliW [Candidatus Velthaea sp.]|jgi:flagellar assembly factor FliW